MGIALLDGGCSGTPAVESDKVAHEGLLAYESRAGVWKQRWFVLDADRLALVKCATSARQRARSYGSALGGDVVIKDAQPLTQQQHATSDAGTTGLAVTTPSGAHIQFRTATAADAAQWLATVARLGNGFSAGVGERLADRALLANKYSLVRELGRGASGIVSLYTWRGAPFAIKKVVPPKTRGIIDRRVVGIDHRNTNTSTNSTSSSNKVPDAVRREIALLKRASCLPHVVQLHDVILDAAHSEYYLVMEFLGGGAVADWDADRKCYVSGANGTNSRNTRTNQLLDSRTLRRYATHILKGVQALHRHRLCHRDIKPENIFVSADRLTCKLGDLGVAHYFREDAHGELYDELDVDAIEPSCVDVSLESPVGSPVGSSHVSAPATALATHSTDASAATDTTDSNTDKQQPHRRGLLQSTKGTYQFLPPEALSGHAFDGFAADVWAVGVTLYALAYGNLPFYASDVTALFTKIECDDVVFPSAGTSNDDDDAALQHLLLGALTKDPAQRLSIDALLAHPWLQSSTNNTGRKQRTYKHALARTDAAALLVADCDLEAAVSVLDCCVVDTAAGTTGRPGSVVAAGTLVSTTTDVAEAIATVPPYVPRPVASAASASLPQWLEHDTPRLAAQLHFDWCRAKCLDGWRVGAVRDDAARVHPSLQPWRELSAADRNRNVECVVETMRCVVALGCELRRPRRRASSIGSTGTAVPTLDTTYEPLCTDAVTLSWEMLLLIDLLAEHAHEVWAAGYVAAGWTRGAHFDATQRLHPSLQPYMALDEHEKDASRGAVASVLKACLCLGYSVSCARRQLEC